MNTNQSSNQQSSSVPGPGPEAWVAEAIAQQEEYLRRIRACSGVPLREHHWVAVRPRGPIEPGAGVAAEVMWEACVECGVTRTDADYQRRLAAG